MGARLLSSFLVLMLGLVGCSKVFVPWDEKPEEIVVASIATSDWDSFVEQYLEEFYEAHPAFAVSQGRHDFDGQLPDWSRQGILKEITRLKAQKKAALSFSDDELTAEQQYQRDYLVAVTDRNLFWMDDVEWPFRNPQFYVDWLLDTIDPNVYIARPYAPAEERMQAYTAYAKNAVTAAGQIRDNLRTPMPRTYINLGVSLFGGLAEYFKNDVPLAFAEVEDEALNAAFTEANDAAAEAMQELADWLEEQLETATEDYAIGPELFQKMLWATERVDITLEELEAVGRKDLERNLKALAEACKQLVGDASIQTCINRVSSHKPEGDVVQEARNQLIGLKRFVIDNRLASIPGTEEAKVEEAPPYNRSNFAYIDTAGPYDKGMPSVYYIAPPDPSWPEEEQLGYIPGKADLLFTSVHEVWTGHFLNFLHANRSDWLFGQVFIGYAYAEGWAHYSEEMMWEAGLGDGQPEVHIGQLLNALLRNARFLSTIGLHTQGMTVEESEALFRETAYQDPGNARQQAARGTYDPAYLNYTMGKLMIRQLREDWTASRGGRDAWRRFHDAFLSYGGPPVPLVRAQMLGGEPEATFYTEE